MICEKCGYELESGKNVCPQCYPLNEDNAENDAEPTYEKKQNSPASPYVPGMIISLIIVVLSFFIMGGAFSYFIEHTDDHSTVYTSYEWYGGDAYTGIQQAGADASNNAASAANNVAQLKNVLAETGNGIQDCISGSIGILVMAIGGIGFSYFYAGYKRNNIH